MTWRGRFQAPAGSRSDNDDGRERTVGGAVRDESVEVRNAEIEALVREELSQPDHADYLLITDYLSGELSPVDRERFEDRLRSDPEFRELAEPLLLIGELGVARQPRPIDLAEADRTWDKVKERMGLEELGIRTLTRAEKRSRWRHGRNWVLTSIAALFTGWVVSKVEPRLFPAPGMYVHFDASFTQDSSTTLRDETQVTLAAGSRLSYLPWFGDADEDTLSLDGEGTFTIAPGPRRPLVIDGPGVEVTAFEGRLTVEAFAARPIAYVKVHEGRAAVRTRTVYGYGEVLTLRAGESARVGPGLRIDRVDAPIAAHRRRIK